MFGSGCCSARTAGVELACTGTLPNTNPARTATTSAGNTGVACCALSLMGTRFRTGTKRVATAHSFVVPKFLEAVAIKVLIDAALRTIHGTMPIRATTMLLCARGERLSWQPGGQRRPGYDPRNTPDHLPPPQLIIGQRFGQIFKPVRHCFSPLFITNRCFEAIGRKCYGKYNIEVANHQVEGNFWLP